MTHIAIENWWAWGVGIPLVGALLLLQIWSGRRRGGSWPKIATLAALRAATFLIVLLLLSRPVQVDSSVAPAARDRVVVLVDRSGSMSLEGATASRYRQAVELLRNGVLPALSAAELTAEPFLFADDTRAASGAQIANATPDGRETNLARAIAQTLTQAASPPLAIIALTDGVATVEADNARAITALVENQVPLIAIAFGDDTAHRALSLDGVVAPPEVPLFQEFNVAAQLRVTGQGEAPAFELLLLRDGQFAQRKSVSAGPGMRAWQESFRVTEQDEGTHRYTIQVLPPDDPTMRCPNLRATVAVRVVDEKSLRVLFVQGGLTWDYKFIRIALQGDPTIELSGLSRVSSQSVFLQSVDNSVNLASGFPATLDQLATFRVVVLANLRSRDLTKGQQELLARFCGELGGGVLMIGGAGTFDAAWRRSRLEELLPVRFSPPSRRRSGRQPVRLSITDQALAHPVFQISGAGDSRTAWSQLPAFERFARVDSVKPGAQVWAVAATGRNIADRPAVIASQRYGAGLTAVICVQNFWRWRLAQESNPQHFDRFWQQLLRYLGEGNRAAIAIRLPDQRLEPEADIRLLLERRPEPTRAAAALYHCRVTDATNRRVTDQTLELRAGRAIEVRFHADRAGLFQVAVLDQHNVTIATRGVEIRRVDHEFLATARNLTMLRQWSALSEGVVVRAEDCDNAAPWVDTLKKRSRTPPRRHDSRRPMGINGWMLTILLGCLCSEWLLRKQWRLL